MGSATRGKDHQERLTEEIERDRHGIWAMSP